MKIQSISELETLAKKGANKLNSEKPQLLFGLSTCGVASGGEKVREFAQEYLRKKGIDCEITPVGCIGMCHAEPLVDVKLPGKPRVTYGDMDNDKIKRVIEEHLVKGNPVKDYCLAQLSRELSVCEQSPIKGLKPYDEISSYEDLPFFKKQVRIVLRNCGIIDPEDITQYIARGGYFALLKTFYDMEPEDVLDELKTSGLRGRGGAGFPTGLKWEFCRKAPGDVKYIICNADEGDPGAYMDRAVLEGDPHSVLEGMIIGAYAMGATEGYIYIRTEYPLAIKRLHNAIGQAREMGLLGKDIMGSGFSFDIFIREGAGVFVCGEETALINSIEGKRGEPRPRPPFPAARGLWGKPTNINNVETWANIAMIIEKGGKWFASMGTEKSKGTKVFSLVGKAKNPGLIEVKMGIKIKDIIYEIGGGIQNDRKFKAVQTGGPSGGCIPAQHLGVQVDYETLKDLGSIVGSGGMVVLDEDTCMVDVARYFLGFTAEESCGKCTPCRIGTRKMLQILENICKGKGTKTDLNTLADLSVQVRDSSLCALGGTAPNPVLTTLKYFRHEYEDHVLRKKCTASVCASLFRAPCQNSCPVSTDVPGFIQLIQDGRNQEALELNLEDNPLPSVCGRVCEHPCESRCQRAQLDESLAIRDLKRFCTEMASGKTSRKNIKLTRLDPTDKKVAVVGGGPSGMSAAYFLTRLGHEATIFESSDKLGGMLRYAIPRYRLPEAILDRDIATVLELGVHVNYGCEVGVDKDIPALRNEFDAVYLAVGAQNDRELGIPDEAVPGILQGLELLRDLNNDVKPKLGKKVLVVGGGNVAIDVARQVARQGCDVTICYRREEQDMPAYREEVEEAKTEGVKFHFLAAPEKVLKKDGRATGMTFRLMAISEYDTSGRRTPVNTDETFDVKADTIVTAIGQVLDEGFAGALTSQLMGEAGLVEVDEHILTTNCDLVFAGGDAVTGPASVVEAIAQGKRAAGSIDRFLMDRDGFAVLSGMKQIRYSMKEPADNEKIMERERPKQLDSTERTGDSEVVQTLGKDSALKETRRCFRCDLSSGEVE